MLQSSGDWHSLPPVPCRNLEKLRLKIKELSKLLRFRTGSGKNVFYSVQTKTFVSSYFCYYSNNHNSNNRYSSYKSIIC